MVDNGNLNEVAIEIKIAATIIFTDALIISKAGSSNAFLELICKTGTSNWELIFSLNFDGTIADVNLDAFIANLTKPLDKKFGSNLSFVSLCLAKSISVLVTFLALDDTQSVITITIPAINNKRFGVGTLVAKTSIENISADIPDATQAS